MSWTGWRKQVAIAFEKHPIVFPVVLLQLELADGDVELLAVDLTGHNLRDRLLREALQTLLLDGVSLEDQIVRKLGRASNDLLHILEATFHRSSHGLKPALQVVQEL